MKTWCPDLTRRWDLFGEGMIPNSRDRCCVYPENMLHGILIALSIFMIDREPPALSEVDQIRLEATADGRDSLGEGVATLVENSHLWQVPNEGAEAPDLRLLRESPAMFRGDVFVVNGVLQQQAKLDSPWEGVSEWFVRDAEGIPFTLYVVGDIDMATGSTIVTTARFYKTMSFEGRDKQLRLYPAFVTPVVAISPVSPSSASYPMLLAIPFLGIASIVVFVLARSSGRKSHRSRIAHVQTDDVLDAMSESSSMLSDDPAQALELMYDKTEIKV